MNEFLGLLKKFKENGSEFVAGINGKEVTVKVADVNGDMVTIVGTENRRRYDLCYTQIVVCSSIPSGDAVFSMSPIRKKKPTPGRRK